mgnify:CR=1 FL=1
MQFVGKKRFFDDRPCGQKYFQKWAESGLLGIRASLDQLNHAFFA